MIDRVRGLELEQSAHEEDDSQIAQSAFWIKDMGGEQVRSNQAANSLSLVDYVWRGVYILKEAISRLKWACPFLIFILRTDNLSEKMSTESLPRRGTKEPVLMRIRFCLLQIPGK